MATLIAATSAGSSDGLSVTTSGIDTTGADLIVVCLSTWATPTNPTDSYGNTWTLETSVTGGDFFSSSRMFSCVNPTVGAGHTFTDTNALNRRPSLAVLAFSGFTGSVPQPSLQKGSGNTAGTSCSTASVTPAADNYVVISLCTTYASTQPSVSGGALAVEEHVATSGTNCQGCTVAYEVQTTATAISASWSWSAGTSGGGAILVAFPFGAPPPNEIKGSVVFGVTTTVTATRSAAFGLDGAVNVHDEAGKLKVFGDFEVTGDVTMENPTFMNPETLFDSIVTTGTEIVFDSDGNVVFVNG